MKKVLMSLFTIAIVGALIGGGVVAYFFDVEEMEGNLFQAGTIDIELSNNNNAEGVGIQLTDMKPCDYAEYKFFVHNVGTNPGPLYLHLDVGEGYNAIWPRSEPEREAEKELGGAMDDIENWITVNLTVDKLGDDEDPEVIIFVQDHIKLGLLDCLWIPLDTALNGWLNYCDELEVTLSFHLQAETGNEYQGDAVNFDVEVMMTDHNMPPPDPIVLFLENKDGVGGQDMRMWEKGDGTWGYVIFDPEGDTFDYTLYAYGLETSTPYDLIYYADPWPGDNPGPSALIGTHSTGTGGNINGQPGSKNLGMDLPGLADGNYPTGAKIWLVPSIHFDGSKMVGWAPAKYLYETVLIKYYDTDVP